MSTRRYMRSCDMEHFSLVTDLRRADVQCPTRYRLRVWKSPNRLQTQRATTTTTTTFSIDLMDDCMGIKRFTSQSNTPTATSANTTSISGKVRLLSFDRSQPSVLGFHPQDSWPRDSFKNDLLSLLRRLHWHEQPGRLPSETSAWISAG